MKKNINISEDDAKKALSISFCKTDWATALGFPYFNGQISKVLDELIAKYNLDCSHFSLGKKKVKYPLIKKRCPVCNLEFEIQEGHPKEKTTCSYKCSNIYFADVRHTEVSKLKVSNALRARKKSPLISSLNNKPKRIQKKKLFDKQCIFCRKNFQAKKSGTRFCSLKCATVSRIADGTHKGWSTRSKLCPSFPEKVVIGILNELNVSFERELKCDRWFIDFADPERKIALEIDGRQHELPERKASDQKKDSFLIENGWTVNRIKWKRLTVESRKELKEKIQDIFKT